MVMSLLHKNVYIKTATSLLCISLFSKYLQTINCSYAIFWNLYFLQIELSLFRTVYLPKFMNFMVQRWIYFKTGSCRNHTMQLCSNNQSLTRWPLLSIKLSSLTRVSGISLWYIQNEGIIFMKVAINVVFPTKTKLTKFEHINDTIYDIVDQGAPNQQTIKIVTAAKTPIAVKSYKYNSLHLLYMCTN